MRRINKSENLIATEYHRRLAQHEMPGKYNSSDNLFYLDVLFNLIYCQKGLCAYTEKEIISEEEIEAIAAAFKGGRNTSEKPEMSVNIEHFDSFLKPTQGWQWDNLFAVDPRVNLEWKKKRELEARKKFDFQEYMFMKPDGLDYTPEAYLEYDTVEHRFFPSSDIDDDIAEKIDIVLDFLGVNYGVVKGERRQYLNDQILLNRQPTQYLTAYQFMMKNNEQ